MVKKPIQKISKLLLTITCLLSFGIFQKAYAGEYCFCHNVNEEGLGNEICTGANAFEDFKDDPANHFQHYICWLCNNKELCPDPNDPNAPPPHPDCGFCQDEELMKAMDGFDCSVQDLRGKCSGCGNFITEEGEDCDDGNNSDGDGCDADCHSECTEDSDQDGTPDCYDSCPQDPNKTEEGICGCGLSDADSDEDGVPNCQDNCPNDADKTDPGICGCGQADSDNDQDGIVDCQDNCPNDPDKNEAGICGCGIADTDSDADGVPDCNDNCAEDPAKVLAGICGCGVSDADSDGDGVANCLDNCPVTFNPDQADSDGDSIGDACDQAELPPITPGTPNNFFEGSGVAGCSLQNFSTGGVGIFALIALLSLSYLVPRKWAQAKKRIR